MALAGKPAAQRDFNERGLGGQKPLRPRDPRRPDPALQRHAARGVKHPVQVEFGKPDQIGQSAKPDRAVQMRGDPVVDPTQQMRRQPALEPQRPGAQIGDQIRPRRLGRQQTAPGRPWPNLPSVRRVPVPPSR